jgi:membrane-bound lytic murein transglycosylase D
MRVHKISFLVFTFLFLGFTSTFAQIPQVPAEIEFADLIVRINPQARREIQLDVDAQYRNPSYFKIKQDRVNLYLPLIERELREAGVPLDLKYLAIQESGLISDAVSTSNAVGFWQFKQGTAEEVFLRVDNQVDERQNIVSSTKGAALYLQKHNKTFDNWMCALVSYQMGLGGAKAYFGTQYNGKRVVDIDRNSHWYFKKFLAHKIAFENQIGIFVSNSSQQLVEVKVQGPTTLSSLAKKYGVSESHLKEYNTWAKNGKVLGDRPYSLVFLKDGSLPNVEQAVIKESAPKKTTQSRPSSSTSSPSYKQANSYPKVAGNTTKSSEPDQITVNNLDGVQAASTTSPSIFSENIGLKEKKFRKLNDLDEEDRIEAGKYYYTEKKKSKAEVETHIVQQGETLWNISQKYGIKLSSLKSKNRIRKDSDLKVGMVLNLQDPRRRGEEIEIVRVPAPTPLRTVVAESTKVTENQVNSSPEPMQRSAAPSKVTHTVSSGETLFAISKKYGISVDELKSWNGIGSQNIISIGQKLVIYRP